jgi:UDP-glucuronate 4-epimerase
MKVLVTGSAGFIGSNLTIRLLERGDNVIGIDNHNDYYDPAIKESRLARHSSHPNYIHLRVDLNNREAMEDAFRMHRPQRVINLAAQAGVRYSIENPRAYINSNILGFSNILECCSHYNVEHLVYASSSSVYGANTQIPFSIHDSVDHPLSIYAATKKANELMAHSYSHIYGLPTTGLRFFTVYGPWGRPDMALFKFTRAILAGEPIQVFNGGNHKRSFSYIDDIIESVIRVLDRPAFANQYWDSQKPDPASSQSPWRIYNVGNSSSVELMDCIAELEKALGRKALINLWPLQKGDVQNTCADISDLELEFGFAPQTPLKLGIEKFVAWYCDYFS